MRHTEELVRTLYSLPVKVAVNSSLPANLKKIEDNLVSHFNTRVRIKQGKKGKGSILFEYYSNDELTALLDKFNINVS